MQWASAKRPYNGASRQRSNNKSQERWSELTPCPDARCRCPRDLVSLGSVPPRDSKSAEGNLVRVRLSPRALSTLSRPTIAGISTAGQICTHLDPAPDDYAAFAFGILCRLCRLLCAERAYARRDAGLCHDGSGGAADIRPRAQLIPGPSPRGPASGDGTLCPASLLRQSGHAGCLEPSFRPLLCGSPDHRIVLHLYYCCLATRPPAPLRARTSARLSLT